MHGPNIKHFNDQQQISPEPLIEWMNKLKWVLSDKCKIVHSAIEIGLYADCGRNIRQMNASNSNSSSLIDFAFNLNSNYNNYYFAEQTSVLFIASTHNPAYMFTYTVYFSLQRFDMSQRVWASKRDRDRNGERWCQEFICWIACACDCIPNTNIWGKLPNKPLPKPLLIAVGAQWALLALMCVERERQRKIELHRMARIPRKPKPIAAPGIAINNWNKQFTTVSARSFVQA